MTTTAPIAAHTSTTTKKRTLFLVANNIEEIGGLQRVMHTLAGGFAARGHQVTLIGIAPGPRGQQLTPGPGYRTVTLAAHEPTPWYPAGIRARLRLVKQAKEFVRRRIHARNVARFEELLSGSEDAMIVVGQVWAMQWVADARTGSRPVIAMSHESYEASRGLIPTAMGSTRYRRIMDLYPPVDKVLFLTHADARKFEVDGLCNVGVMHNPLPIWPEQTSELTEQTVVAIGRLETEKRYDRLIEAWQLVTARHPGWRLRIYGAGSLKAALEAQITASGLDGSVSLEGPTQDVEGVLQAASVLALSSEQEGLPLVLGEAMACGVPCVAFDCAPGIREIVRDREDGLVVRNRDVNALADSLCRLIEDESLRHALGKTARHNIERFRMEHILDEWDRLFVDIER
jgi:glycosyltransferase involved in cell wall biosynthesis